MQSTRNSILRALLVSGAAITAAFAPTMAQPCDAPATWTNHASVPAPDNNVAPTTNCAFHQWSWNAFLWMTQSDGSGLRFENFATIEELLDPATSAPAAFKALPQQKTLVLKPRSRKISFALGSAESIAGIDSINQAGSNGILVHKVPGSAGGRPLYFSQSVNSDYFNFIRSNMYYQKAKYAAAPADQDFPIGAMEFKYSWMIVEPGQDVSTFFTAPAEIEMLVADSTGKVVVDPSKTMQVQVALVGVHVVGVVKDHPEFVWATFEHIGNAPDLPAGMPITSASPVSDKDFTFYAANTPAKDSNVSNNGTVHFEDKTKQTVKPVVNVFRQFAWGSDMTTTKGQANAKNIMSLNASVAAQVLSGDPIWKNYQLIGAVWGEPNSLKPGQPVTPIGSTKLSNATLETFTQNGLNCFTCHGPFSGTASSNNMNMNISHIMKNAF